MGANSPAAILAVLDLFPPTAQSDRGRAQDALRRLVAPMLPNMALGDSEDCAFSISITPALAGYQAGVWSIIPERIG